MGLKHVDRCVCLNTCYLFKRNYKMKELSEEQRIKACERSKKHYEKNKQAKIEYQRKWREKNREYHRKYSKQWNNANKEAAKLKLQNWYKNNPGKRTYHSSLRKKRIAQATPDWLSAEQLIDICTEYEICAWCNEVTGEVYHVDHIVPLKGKNVCGLHVAWNLRVIPAKENMSKGNKYNG